MNLRDGWDADRQNEDPGIPLADFTTVSGGDRVAAPRPIVRNKGISRGIAEEAAKDIAAIQAQVANLEAIRTKARAARDALAAEIARLRTEAAGLDRPDDPATPDIDESGKAQRERARADRIRTVTIPALETARDALDQPLSQEARTDLEDEIARLKDLSGLLAAKADLERQKTMLESELTPLEDEQKALQARLALFDDGNAGNDPTDAGCSSTLACQTALNAKTDEVNAKASAIVNKQVEIDAQETSINTRRSEIAAKEEEIATDDARKEAFDAKQAEIDAEEGRATDIDAQADRHAKQQDAYEDDVIPDLEDKLAEIDNHLENIGPSVQTAADRLAAERLVVSEHAQASLILDRLAGAAGSGTLTVRKTQDASELDTAGGDAVFARAPRPAAGLDGEGVLRALATAGGRPDAVTDEDHAQSLANLNEALADHWRIDLTGFLVVADTGLSADDRAALDGTTGGQYVRGTFRGVYGTFYCALSVGCKDISAGVPGAFADGWHFTPAALTRTGAGTDQDPYVYAVGRYDEMTTRPSASAPIPPTTSTRMRTATAPTRWSPTSTTASG